MKFKGSLPGVNYEEYWKQDMQNVVGKERKLIICVRLQQKASHQHVMICVQLQQTAGHHNTLIFCVVGSGEHMLMSRKAWESAFLYLKAGS